MLTNGAARSDHLAALIASSAELSTLSRNLHRLTSLLRQGSVRAAQEYREMLDTVADDEREHLTLASAALADLRATAAHQRFQINTHSACRRATCLNSPTSTAS